jgi:hypothetical protein
MIPQVMQAYMQRLKMQSDVAEQQMKIVAGHYDEATNRILSVAGQPEALQMVDEYAQKGFIDPAQATAFKRFLNVGPNATPEQKEQARFAFASYLSGGKDIVDQTLKAQAEKRQGLELQVNALAKDAELRIAQKKLQVEVARLGLDATKLHFIQTPNGTVSTNEYTGGLQIPQVPSITGLGGSVIAQASDPSLIPTGQPAGPSMPAGGAGHGLVPIAKPGQFGQSIENMIASTTPGAQVTRFRSLARNAQLPGSAANSGHTTDNKVDVTPPKGMTLDQLYSAYKNVAYDPVSNPQGLWRIIREKDHLDIGPAPTLATLPSLASIPQMLAATNNPAYTNQFKPGYVPEYTPPHVAQYVPIGGQPSGGQPSGGQPSGGQPSGGQPSGGQPSGGQPAANVIPGTQPTLYTPAQQQAISVQSSLRLARQLYDTIQQSAKAGAIPSATASPLSNFATNLYGIHAYGGMPVGSFLPGANQSLSQREKMSGLAVQLTKALQNIHGPVEKGQSTTGNMQVRTQQEFSTFLSSLGGGAANNTSAEARIQSLNGLLTSLGLPPADRIPPNAVQQRAQQRSQSSNAPAAPTRDGVLHGALVQ